MKNPIIVIALLVSTLAGVQAQVTGTATQTTLGQPALPAPTAYSVVENGPNHRVWERTIYEPGPNGTVVGRKHRVTELSTGLNFLQNGRWTPSREQIDLLPPGGAFAAAATHGQHSARFPLDIATGLIQLTAANQQQLTSRPVALFLEDDNGSALIGVLSNSVGELVGSNVVVYPNAFEGATASIRYTYTKAGLEQDVVVEGRLPDPSAFGLDPARTRLGVLTAFFDTSNPVQTSAPTDPQTGLSDPTLTFGGMMKMMHGRAFSIGEAGQSQSPMDGTPTFKRWFQLGGHNFLMEEVPYPRVAAQLQQLPPSTGRLTTASTNLFAADSFLDAIPARLLSPSASGEPVKTQTMRLSRVDRDQTRAVVLDYVLVNADTNNFTLQGDTTYLVSGWVNFNGATTIEGGTVVKYDDAVGSIICFEGTVACKTGPYRPAIFTSRNDTSVGEDVNDGGSLSFYQAIAGTAVGNSAWHNLIVRYAQYGIHYYSVNLTDCQFVNCQDALYTEWGPANLTNVLFVNVNTPFAGTTYNATGYHLTIDGCTNGQLSSDWAGRGLSTVQLVNSLLVNAGADGDAAITTNYTVRLVTNPASIFQAVGAGNCYLKTNSPYHQQGTTNITPAILADIATKTTYPPIVYSNITISAATTFSPQARRDTNSSPDLGYHYDPLDYVFGGVNVYSSLTFTAGTAMGYFELPGSGGAGYGISIFDNVVLALNGTASQPCTVARYSTVQEGGTGLWRDKGWLAAIAGQSLSGGYGMNPANAAQVWPNFTRHAALAGDPPHYREYSALLKVAAQNSEFWGTGVGAYWEYLNFTNCLFDRAGFGNLGGNPAICGMRNCTMHGGSITLCKYGLTWPVWIEECAFDGTTFSVDDNSNGNTNITYCDFNAFLTNGNRLPMRGAHDVTSLPGFNWQSSWFGNYYLPPNSPLINAGSTTADQVGLYWFTTQTNQVPEGFSIVDIGYHYPLNNIDSDADGLPDWWELYWFGNLGHSGSDFDSGGVNTLLTDYQNYTNGLPSLDPNVIAFALSTTNDYVNTNFVAVQVSVMAGWPSYQAVLVNSTNFAGAAWTSYTSTNLTVNLGSLNDGNYAVWVGLDGSAGGATPTWQEIDFTIDTKPPVLVITNPAASTVGVPLAQVQGYANEQLAAFTFDLSNATGVVTGQQGNIMSQDFDTNRWKFTTNYFQCFDIMLTPGTNLVTLHATDFAGNTTNCNLLINLDYSIRTNLPVLQLTWPQDGMNVSGTSFTLDGFVDDPMANIAAQIVDAGGDTNFVTGVVERTGRFWVDNLPLAAGNNPVTVTVTDAAGHTSTTNINVIQSSVTLTINLPTDLNQLWQSAMNLTGAISGSGYTDVSVNGITATVNGNSWTAANVPVTPGGVACFTAMATGGGQTQANAKSSPPKPDTIGLMVWHDDQTMHEYDDDLDNQFWYDPCMANSIDVGQSNETWTTSHMSQHWDYGYGGAANSTNKSDHTIWDEQQDPNTGGPLWVVTSYPQTKFVGGWQFYSKDLVPYDYQNTSYTIWTGDTNRLNMNTVLGCEYCDVQNNYDTDTFNCNTWGESQIHHTYTRRANTVMVLLSGGRAIPGRQILHEISGWVKHVPPPYTDGQQPPYYDVNQYIYTWFHYLPCVSNNLVHLLGNTLHDDPNYPAYPDQPVVGTLYYVTAAGADPIQFTPTVVGDKFYVWGVNDIGYGDNDSPSFRDAPHEFVHQTVHRALTNTNLDRTMIGVGEEVNIGFEPPVAANVLQWFCWEGGLQTNVSWTDAINGASAGGVKYTAPSNEIATLVGVTVRDVPRFLYVSFQVFQPSGYDPNNTYKVFEYTNSPYLFGQGVSGAGMHLNVVMAPTFVSFYKVEVLEVGTNASSISGYYADPYNYTNPPVQLAHNNASLANQWYPLRDDNSWPYGDDAFWYGDKPPWSTNGYSGGKFTWVIPGLWKIGSGKTNSIASGWDQKFTLGGDGTMTIKKFGQTVTRSVNSP